MERRANYVAVGAFVLLLLLGLFIAVLWLVRVQFRQEYQPYRAYFQGPVTGLGTGALVRLNGIEVGRVSELALDPNNPRQVSVSLQIRSGVTVREDSVASLETQGLTGVSYVEITGGSQAASELKAEPGQDVPVIRARQSTLQQVVTSAPEVLARLVVISDRLALLLDDQNRQAIADTLANIRDITATFKSHSPEIDQMLGDGARSVHSLGQTLQSLNATIDEVHGLAAGLKATPERLDQVLGSANDAARRFGQVANDIDGVLQANRPQIREFTGVGLSQFTQLLSELRTLVANLTRVSAELERDPTRFLFGDRRQGYNPR